MRVVRNDMHWEKARNQYAAAAVADRDAGVYWIIRLRG
jgi:hypothetical protein